MLEWPKRREQRGEAFWREHHEAWKRSDLNQREYCEAVGLNLKAFSSWRCKFRTEPEPFKRKLLYRHGGLSHSLSHTLSHTLNHGAYPSSQETTLIVPPPRDGHRRRFSETERRRILAEAEQPGATLSEVARRHGIGRRLLCRWKEELAPAVFLEVEIADGAAP